jgi:hypothetical protein
MVPSSVLTVATDGEHLWCDGFSIGEPIHFGSLEFITDRFGDLSILLMAKFGKSEKTGLSDFLFQTIWFW